MRNRIFAVLALAVIAGGGLAYATFNAINAQPVKTVNAPTQPVVVAARPYAGAAADEAAEVLGLGQRTLRTRRGDLERVLLAHLG